MTGNGEDDGQDATTGLPCASLRDESGGMVGERIGPYRLISMLGRGGMGEVYVAEQAVPVRRSVALKLLRTRRLDVRSLSHFEIERQLLAQMRHPAIAQIFDAGTTADGRPYSAMELIEGPPITAYCAQEQLPLRARLRLFSRVCEGVQHAHQKGVAHRDLKPSNILVAKVDERALPKIIDFGIASMMSGGSSDATGVMGTPAYMSPEQAETPHDIDTRSDIYSLGVLLHELLCGHRPERAARHAYRPSATFAALPPLEQKRIADELGLDPRVLLRLLTRELDWVVAKATAPDRSLRYASATELAADLLRFLDGQPLVAVPPSRMYRLGKFARRQRAGITAAAVVLLALLGGLGMSLYGLERARAQQALAEERAKQLESVSRFQQSMLEDIDIESMGVALSGAVRDQLQRAVPDDPQAFDRMLALLGPADLARGMIDTSLLQRADTSIARDFADQPLLAADLRESVARVRKALALHAAAADGYAAVADARASVLGDRAPATLRARVQRISELLLAGRNHLPQTLALQDQLRQDIVTLDDRDPLRVRFEFDEAVARTVDDPRAHRAKLETLLQHSRERVGEDAEVTLEIANSLAIVLVRIGERPAAIALLEELLPLHVRVFGALHPDTRAVKQNLAIARVQSGDHDGAIALQRGIVDDDARRLGSEHPLALAARGNLANMLDAAGQSEEALKLASGVLEANMRVLGPSHGQTLRSRLNNASFLAKMGRFDDALRFQSEVIDVRTRVLGPGHPDTLSIRSNNAATLHQAGRSAEALALLERLLPEAERVLGPGHPTAQDAMDIRGMIARETGNRALEIASLETLLQWRLGAQGAQDWKTVETAWRLSEAMDAIDRGGDAQDVRDRYVAPLLHTPPQDRSPAQKRLADAIQGARKPA